MNKCPGMSTGRNAACVSLYVETNQARLTRCACVYVYTSRLTYPREQQLTTQWKAAVPVFPSDRQVYGDIAEN